MSWDVGNLEGLLPILLGIYVLLLARGILPRNPAEPEKWLIWQQKFGLLLTITCPLVMVLGVLTLTGLV